VLDQPVRAWLEPLLDAPARGLVRARVGPTTLTVLGLLLALAAALAAGFAAWWLALGLWLVSRIPDGLDGPVARLSGRESAFGGWADLSSDMTAYGAFVVGCAIGQPDARIACLVLLLTYYVNGGSLLAYSAAAERARVERPDERTFHFTRGLAEGTETIAVHALMVLFPAWMATIAWVFAGAVVVTILQRIWLARRVLGRARIAADRRGSPHEQPTREQQGPGERAQPREPGA
jgi:phosphatidylglycerophosphate synthase